MSTLKFGSRYALVGSLAFAAAIGCSQKTVVFDPPQPGPTPSQPNEAPVFGGVANMAPTPPLPISGGTLMTMTRADGSAIAIASDPDEDAIHVVSLADPPALLGTLYLQPGDEPGRLVADAAGRVHVALRRGGAIATIMPNDTGASLVMRRSVCSAPRGVDYDAKTDSVWVACATGELMALPASGGDASLNVQVDRDLRDVVVDGDTVYVTRFRTAEILTLDRTGTLQKRTTPPIPSGSMFSALPDVAWRAIHARGPGQSGLRLVYQLASTDPIDLVVPPGVSSYGSSEPTQQNGQAGGVVTIAVGRVDAASGMGGVALMSNPVVDLALSPNGNFETVSVTGTIESDEGGTVQFPLGQMMQPNDPTSPSSFVAIADARDAKNPVVVVQMHGKNPGIVVLRAPLSAPLNAATVDATVTFPQRSTHYDTGYDVFSTPTAAGIACMNCHPEGGDDSHTWKFQLATGTRARRTQSLRGGVITPSAPYHWDGDMADLQTLCDEVFTHRMGGGSMTSHQTPVLARFLNSMPRIPVSASLDPLRVAKGQAIFVGSGGCASCHTDGGRGTLQANQDIGKVDVLDQQAALQVPMLVDIADRAPYMHDGCAKTLLDRLNDTQCAGSTHGNTAQLSDDDKQNLVEYLESL